jgi:hypothetical protein
VTATMPPLGPDAADLTMTDRRWADATEVHLIAARLDMKRPCQFCGVALYDHPGVLTVLLNDVDPDCPSVFGASVCAQRWVDRTPWQPSFRPIAGRDWAIGAATYTGGVR